MNICYMCETNEAKPRVVDFGNGESVVIAEYCATCQVIVEREDAKGIAESHAWDNQRFIPAN